MVAPDFPGYGESSQPPWPGSVENLTRFVEGFTAAMDLDRVALVGLSMGGMVAINFALNHPDRVNRLVLVDSAGLDKKIRWIRLIYPTVRARPLYTLMMRLRTCRLYASAARSVGHAPDHVRVQSSVTRADGSGDQGAETARFGLAGFPSSRALLVWISARFLSGAGQDPGAHAHRARPERFDHTGRPRPQGASSDPELDTQAIPGLRPLAASRKTRRVLQGRIAVPQAFLSDSFAIIPATCSLAQSIKSEKELASIRHERQKGDQNDEALCHT